MPKKKSPIEIKLSSEESAKLDAVVKKAYKAVSANVKRRQAAHDKLMAGSPIMF